MKNLIRFLISVAAFIWIANLCSFVYAEMGDIGIENIGEVVNGEGLPDIYIKAVNPGYKIDGINNVGEMIEIARRDANSDAPILLAGFNISYTNSSGNTVVLATFPEHSKLTGEKVLLRLASSPDAELANFLYKTTLGMDGGIQLMKDDVKVDEVCWTGKDGCYKKFDSKNPTVLVREGYGELFKNVSSYEPNFKAEDVEVVELTDDEGYGEIAPKCKGLIFAEILSYYVETKTEQFVEFYNTGTETIMMDGCFLRYKNKDYTLSGQVASEGYLAWWLKDFNVTKNPTNMGVLELIDADGAILDRLEYPNGQRKGTSWALIGYDSSGGEIWRTTYKVTPSEANIYQEYKSCEDGKVINEETGNCVKVSEVSIKTCPDGQYLNPLTGRCRKIIVEEEKECAEGYEINPETGRYRKVKNNDGADYRVLSEEYKEEAVFVAILAVLGVVGVGATYIIWEYRKEIKKWYQKITKKNK